MKDYYKILEVPENATHEQIRKAYRRLALKYHPDRNPADPGAEERFKEIAEAYGVLVDAAKRARFDQWRESSTRGRTADNGFRFNQEEILRDLFRDPRFNQVFQDLFREFNKAGFRFDQRFFNQTFFGGKGMFFGGFFVFGPFGSSRRQMGKPGQKAQVDRPMASHSSPLTFLANIGKKIGGYLSGTPKALPHHKEGQNLHPLDLNYHLSLSADAARAGTWVMLTVDRGRGKETLRVRIPAGTKPESRLRLKGKGSLQGKASGDLYLTVHVK